MSQNNLNIFSLNVRGLRSDKKKRLKIFNTFKNKRKGIIFLQETHSTPDVEISWKKRMGW